MSKRIYNFPKVGFTECPNLLWQLGIYEQRYSSLPELFRQDHNFAYFRTNHGIHTSPVIWMNILSLRYTVFRYTSTNIHLFYDVFLMAHI